ncbi:hypothetical protein ACVU7I_19100 [Patulibacter sp. S7RM1-6]
MLPVLRRALLVAPLLLAVAPAAASADAISVAVTPTVVPAGGTFTVRVTPTWTDDQVFRQVAIRVLRPGRSCATPDAELADEDVVWRPACGPASRSSGTRTRRAATPSPASPSSRRT